MKKALLISIISSMLLAGDYYYSNGKKVELTPTNEAKNLRYIGDVKYYKSISTNQKVGVSKRFIISFNDGVNKSEIYKKYNLVEIEALTKEIFLVEANSIDKAIEISAELYESGIVKFAHPDFIKSYKKRLTNPTDPLFSKEWHLIDTEKIKSANINIMEAWEITKGANVKIAVFDDAVDINHEDLKDGVIDSYNATDKTSNTLPDTSDDAHGTFVSGVAVARENGKGVVGVAPEAKLLAMKGATGDAVEDSNIIKAFEWAKNSGADVMNNSWGGYNVTDAVKSTIVDCATNGRDGKGMIITFGHGNDACNDTHICKQSGEGDELGYIKDDESAIEEILAVGATNSQNKRASYSNYGIYLDISAPGGDGDTIDIDNASGIVSTDLSGEMGWSKSSYTNGYGESIAGDSDNNYISNDPTQVGTSYSAPMVAGVAGLIISANPDLTREQIFEILKETADKVGGYTYTDGKSYELGYGRVNAGNAVKKALELKNATTTETTTSSSFDYKFNELGSGWHLLGAVENLNSVKESNNLNEAWSYDSVNGWSKNPSLIEQGKGFWIKK